MENSSFDMTGAVEVEKKVKVITGKDVDDVTRKAIEFEKTHTVIDVKQTLPTVMFVFYME